MRCAFPPYVLSLPPARRQPLLHLVEPVRAPESLAIDDDEGRAEDAGGDRRVGLRLEAILDRLIVERGEHRLLGEALAGGDLGDDFRIGKLAPLAPIGAEGGGG